jgi:MFS superfamily molybdate transporter
MGSYLRHSRRIRFDRHEWAGAFGDIGTDLPLMTGMILATGVAPGPVLVLFGLSQIFSALVYRMPMAVQPLKAVAVIVIAQRVDASLIYAAGLTIGAMMLLLTLTGLLDWLARVIPKSVIRGVQLGLGLKLALIALGDYVPADGAVGYGLAAIAFVVTLLLLGNRRWPAALAVLALGVVYALTFKIQPGTFTGSLGMQMPRLAWPRGEALIQAFVLLALPQIPLSIGNSVLATRQIAHDYFPEAGVTVRKIGWTYSLMNLVLAPLGGFPVCHGSGGLAGHYTFGGRTGGSVVIYGVLFLVLGGVFGRGFAQVVHIFPLPMLGVILLFEALALMRLVRDQFGDSRALTIALLTGLLALALPFGFLIAILTGTTLHYAWSAWGTPRADRPDRT